MLPTLSISRLVGAVLLAVIAVSSHGVAPSVVEVSFTVPEIDARPYHRPYVAIWIEGTDRRVVRNLALWFEEDTWLKDLRQWWRVYGRYQKDPEAQKGVDGFSGATRRPGQYSLVWDGLDDGGETVDPGFYVLCLEAAREDGGRSFVRQPIELSADGDVSPARAEPAAKPELGPFLIQAQ